MRLGNERLGPRGLLLLGATGVLATALAVHGYGRGTVVATGTNPVVGVGTSGGSRVATVHSSSTSPTSSTSRSPSGSSAQKLGPLLGSTQYAPYAYQLYPGQESGQARLAMAGFDVSVRPSGLGTITVSVSAAGGTQGAQTTTYPASDRVYFIEASFGDDSGNTEYNFGDDGVIATNAQGRIVQ